MLHKKLVAVITCTSLLIIVTIVLNNTQPGQHSYVYAADKNPDMTTAKLENNGQSNTHTGDTDYAMSEHETQGDSNETLNRTLSSEYNEHLWNDSKVHEFMGVKFKPFGNKNQEAFYKLLRTLYHSKMYPLDVKSPKSFHQAPNWAAKRGQAMGRYYLHKSLEAANARYLSVQQKKCLEIGDGHFIKGNTQRAWRQKSGQMMTMCDESRSYAMDLVDKRADILADIENPYGTARGPHKDVLGDKFDVIICAQVFEHVNNPFKAIVGLASLLRPGGMVMISVPFMGNPIHGHDVHRFTKTSMANLAKYAGLEVLSIENFGNAMTTLGYLMELSSDDFTEDELKLKDDYLYVGLFAVFRKT